MRAKLGIPRSDTIRDWKHEEGWAALAREIKEILDVEVTPESRCKHGAFRTKYDQIRAGHGEHGCAAQCGSQGSPLAT